MTLDQLNSNFYAWYQMQSSLLLQFFFVISLLTGSAPAVKLKETFPFRMLSRKTLRPPPASFERPQS